MNRNKLKTYAPKARRDFIKAVTDRAAFYGLTKAKTEPITVQGDVAVIGGKPFPKGVAEKRKRLEERINREGFGQVMEAMAYTWFNRFAAIRYMELHGYLEHGYRVFSTTNSTNNTNKGDKKGGNFIDSGLPEILVHAEHVNLPGLDQEKVIELKLDGTKEAELFRMLLISQCNALRKAMPFLFEEIGGYTELLMPDNLLHSNSPVRNLVNEISEEDWKEIEIIGWLYQFYISEKKDQVIGKVVKSEDIPAATQLFTPNWIVKYMVQNSLGAQWLATYPQSPLKGQMEYYIEPAEQTEEVKAQLAVITPVSLDPEALTLIDPACGSGHILVEAYELFKAIYLERGYRLRDVPKLILEKNLFGLDIDERAAQLTGFCLMMKGRADDRRLFERGVRLNVMAFVDSNGFDAEGLAKGVDLAKYGLVLEDLTELKRLFEYAKTFGSLIQVLEGLARKLPALRQLSEVSSQDLFVATVLGRLRPLVRQAEFLAKKYEVVVANPPYMGGKGMNTEVRGFAKSYFPHSKSDLFACFIERGYNLARGAGWNAMVTMQSWMFLSSFQEMRERMLREKTITTMVQIGYNSFPSMNSKVAQATTFSLANRRIENYAGTFVDLNSAPQSADKEAVFLTRGPTNRFDVAQRKFEKIPGSPLAYWLSKPVLEVFGNSSKASRIASSRAGMTTSDNDRFTRQWSEANFQTVKTDSSCLAEALESGMKWFPYNKGGPYRKWFGNLSLTIAYDSQSRSILKTLGNKCASEDCYFQEGVTWTDLTSGRLGARFLPKGSIFDIAGHCAYRIVEGGHVIALGLLNTLFINDISKVINATMHFQPGDFRKIPLPSNIPTAATELIVYECVRLAKKDWNVYERSWDFKSLPILTAASEPTLTLESSYTAWITQNRETVAEMKRLEEENNRLFIDAYGLQDELTPNVPIEQITLTVNPAYRYGGKLNEEEQWTRFLQDTMKELVSYAIGCMMGRYSLDEPGLIYAHSGNEGFDPSRYTIFPADDDGIIPITDTGWFDADACHRLIEFISVAWDATHLEDNLTFLADNLSPKKNETSRETIHRYLCEKFFKDHLQTYKKRPIYWLFSSGKLRAFQCLVYLHRYNEGTLARMRTEYVIPLQGKMAARIEQLSGDINAATSTAHSKKLGREKDKLVKQQAELHAFDEKLRHYADQRISLDLDDGVKVNYGKFGDLLAEVKAVTGKK
ncbi:restriction enzyme family protein [delta proteobacterium NaphS2]|nr:restriction enzyme family protein [delta proteobacterium NaphS2]